MTDRSCTRRTCLPAERVTVRRADGVALFVMCNACFDHRFCPVPRVLPECPRTSGSPMPQLNETCTDHTPSWFVGHWRDWHRGHGCDKDDGLPRSDRAKTEIEQHAANADTGFLTDAELGFLRTSTTAGNDLLVRALDELAIRRRTDMARRAALDAAFDHSDRAAKHFEPLLGYCVCAYCQKLPERDGGNA